jgi:phosphohistidine phosphatase
MAEAETYRAHLKALPDTLERVLLIGHNPGLESLLQMLSGRVESLPTAVIAYISLPITSWSEITDSTEGELIEIWRPKDLPGEKKEPKTEKTKKAVKTAKPEKAVKKPAKKPAEEKKKPLKKDKK